MSIVPLINSSSRLQQVLLPLGRAVSVLERIDSKSFYAIVHNKHKNQEPMSQRAYTSLDVYLNTGQCIFREIAWPLLERVSL